MGAFMSTTADRSWNSLPARSRPARKPRGSWLADYIADVVFIVILAAPFVIFTAPSSVPEAVVSASAAAAAPATPAGRTE
ncbi:MAG TPA: hypothetical protein VGI14_12125 [Casimicrobiaceae bacterium]|jgi:hypothetical protein